MEAEGRSNNDRKEVDRRRREIELEDEAAWWWLFRSFGTDGADVGVVSGEYDSQNKEFGSDTM